MSVQQNVEDAIIKHHILVYSKSYCPHSTRAKTLLASIPKKISEPKIYELDLMGQEGIDIQTYLHKRTSQGTVPNIFIHQKHIGGADDLTNLHNAGALMPLVVGLRSTPSRIYTQRFRLKKIPDGVNQNLLLFILVIFLAGAGFAVSKWFKAKGNVNKKQKL